MDNIKEQWLEVRSKAILEWRDSIGSIMEPELNTRGIKITSYSIIDPAPGNEAIALWMGSWGKGSLEIQAHTANSFSITLIPEGGTVSYWPSSQYHIYDRQNYTIAQLLEWIDSQIHM
jgi:hypothetical protein